MSRRLIIDMGSTNVGGAIVAAPNKGDTATCPHIFASARREITFQAELDLPRFIKEVTGTLKLVVDDLRKELKGHTLESVDCLLSSPFYAAQTRAIGQTSPRPILITPKVVSNILEAESKRVLNNDTTHQIIEQEILEVKLNGYRVVSPYQHHHRAQELEVVNYLSLGSAAVLEECRQILLPLLHHRPVRFHSSALVFYRVFRRLYPNIKNFISLEVGSEITELSLVWGGLVWETMSFPWGHNTLVRKLMGALNLNTSAAFSALTMHLKQVHNEGTMQNISAVLSAAAGEWKRELEKTIKEFSDYQFLPDNILLVADPRTLNLFKMWLEAPPLLPGLPSNKPINTQILSDQVFKNFCHDESILGSDLNLLAGALFVAV